MREDEEVTTKQVVKVITIVASVLFAIVLTFKLFANLDAHEIMVIQSPFSGNLATFTTPGVKWQGWGKITKYPRRKQYSFTREGEDDYSKKIRFNDGGHASLYGATSWEMPLSREKIISAHQTFGSAEAIEQQAVAKMIDAAIYLSGPLMSSTESSGERRSELVQYINDQAQNGVYVTTVKEKDVIDPILGTQKVVAVTEITRDKNGDVKRQQGSMLFEFGIKLLPMSISELKYDTIVESQIKQRQEATTQVQISQANAKRAEQDAITAAKQGEADAAKAKWTQEVIKAKLVTEAQQKLEVQRLATQSSLLYEQEQTNIGNGDAARKRAVFNADGALEQKLKAWVEINKSYAESLGAQKWVPEITFGNSGQSGASNYNDFVQMMTAKSAQDLGLNLGQKK